MSREIVTVILPVRQKTKDPAAGHGCNAQVEQTAGKQTWPSEFRWHIPSSGERISGC